MNTTENNKLIAKRVSDFDDLKSDRPYATVLDIHDAKGEYLEQGQDWSYFETEEEANEFIKWYNEQNRFICGSCGEHTNEYTYNEDKDIDECNNCKED